MTKAKTKAQQVTCISVFPGQRPSVEYTQPWELLKKITKDAYLETIPYPNHYGRKLIYRILCDEEGLLKNYAYNRWGLVGPFLICKISNGRFLKLTDEEIVPLIADLCDVEGGFLSEKCQVNNAIRDIFRGKPLPNPGDLPPNGHWN